MRTQTRSRGSCWFEIIAASCCATSYYLTCRKAAGPAARDFLPRFSPRTAGQPSQTGTELSLLIILVGHGDDIPDPEQTSTFGVRLYISLLFPILLSRNVIFFNFELGVIGVSRSGTYMAKLGVGVYQASWFPGLETVHSFMVVLLKVQQRAEWRSGK